MLKIEALVLFEDRSIPVAFRMSIYDEGVISSDRSTMDQVYRKIEGWPYIWYQTGQNFWNSSKEIQKDI